MNSSKERQLRRIENDQDQIEKDQDQIENDQKDIENDQDEIEMLQGPKLLKFIYRSEYNYLEKRKVSAKNDFELLEIVKEQSRLKNQIKDLINKKIY